MSLGFDMSDDMWAVMRAEKFNYDPSTDGALAWTNIGANQNGIWQTSLSAPWTCLAVL